MGSRSATPFILYVNTRWSWVISFTHRPLYLERKPIITIEIGIWVGFRAGLDFSEMRMISFTCRETSFSTFHRICLKMFNKSFERWQSLNTLEGQHQMKMEFTVIFKILMMTVSGRSVLGLVCATCVPYFNRLPEVSIPTPKHVGVDSYNELYCMICTLLYFIECICCLVH